MTADVEVHPATMDDVFNFLGRFRPEDEILCRSKFGTTALQIAGRFLVMSPVAFAAYWQDVPAALFGVVRDQRAHEVGAPWLLRTPIAESRPVTMAKVARRYMPRLQEPFAVLRDRPLAGEVVVRRWLSWLGLAETGMMDGHVTMEWRRT